MKRILGRLKNTLDDIAAGVSAVVAVVFTISLLLLIPVLTSTAFILIVIVGSVLVVYALIRDPPEDPKDDNHND